MVRKISRLSLVVASLAAGGCAASDPNFVQKNNPGVYSVHQPVVQRSDYVLDLATAGDGLASGEAARLNAWFEALGLGYGDRVSVDAGSYDSAARGDIARVAENYGLLLSDAGPVSGSVQPGMIRVVLSRSSASVPSCPDWSYARYTGAPISTDSNYGCANNKNLAAMIADPTDLVLGQEGSGTDPNAASKPVRAYRGRAGTGAAGTVVAPGVN